MGSLTLPSWISQIGQIASIISDFLVALTAVIGIFGINQWRKQLKFGDQYKTAHRIMGLSLHYRREFELVRLHSPVSELSKTGISDNELLLRIREIQDDFSTRHQHILQLFDIVQKLYEESLEVEGFLGEEEADLTIPLETLYRLLNEKFSDYSSFVQSLKPGTSTDYLLDGLKRNQDILFPPKDDQLSKQVNDAIKKIRKKLKSYMA